MTKTGKGIIATGLILFNSVFGYLICSDYSLLHKAKKEKEPQVELSVVVAQGNPIRYTFAQKPEQENTTEFYANVNPTQSFGDLSDYCSYKKDDIYYIILKTGNATPTLRQGDSVKFYLNRDNFSIAETDNKRHFFCVSPIREYLNNSSNINDSVGLLEGKLSEHIQK